MNRKEKRRRTRVGVALKVVEPWICLRGTDPFLKDYRYKLYISRVGRPGASWPPFCWMTGSSLEISIVGLTLNRVIAVSCLFDFVSAREERLAIDPFRSVRFFFFSFLSFFLSFGVAIPFIDLSWPVEGWVADAGEFPGWNTIRWPAVTIFFPRPQSRDRGDDLSLGEVSKFPFFRKFLTRVDTLGWLETLRRLGTFFQLHARLKSWNDTSCDEGLLINVWLSLIDVLKSIETCWRLYWKTVSRRNHLEYLLR